MSEQHELLWTLCRKLPSDFVPYGERDRDTAEPGGDCSCGCRHFLPLAGEVGNDWGVCANPKSPRAGLFTFEHQGCPQFEDEIESEPVSELRSESAANSIVAQPPPPVSSATPGKMVKIDFDELQLALEGFDTMGEPIRHFLDTETGEIIPLHNDVDDAAELRERIDAGLGERYRSIKPLESHMSFRIMEDFAASLPESALRSRLLDALSRHKPFRHFKEVVHSDLALRDQWFAFRDETLFRHANNWLEAQGIEAT